METDLLPTIEKEFKDLENSNNADLKNSIALFNSFASDKSSKVSDLAELLRLVYDKILFKNLSIPGQDLLSILKLLKILERNKFSLDHHFMTKTIDILLNIAVASSSEMDSQTKAPDLNQNTLICNEILTIFANKLFLYGFLSPDFVNLNGLNLLSALLKSSHKNTDSIFLCSRILFLIAHSGSSIQKITHQHSLPDALSSNIPYLVNTLDTIGPNSGSRFSSLLATIEVLKASYIIALEYEKYSKPTSPETTNNVLSLFGSTLNIQELCHFKRSLETILKFIILSKHEKFCEKLSEYALQFLFILPIDLGPEYSDLWLPKSNGFAIVNKLLLTLKNMLVGYKGLDNTTATPLKALDNTALFILVCILSRLALASDNIQIYIHNYIFGDRDFSVLPEKGDSMRATITRIVSLPFQSDLSLVIGDFVYVICNSDANKVVDCLGFGNVIGYFNTRSSFLSIDLGEITQSHRNNTLHSENFNPVTGVKEDESMETSEILKNMTDEEKEREAERLFVMFDKLNKTGIIKVQPQFGNPDSSKKQ